ncbi:MAG: 3-ketoacyl-ACP reductase [Bacteroidia bacterium]|nr:3-ketoacyl-ACP reductase [Bacteroidia bacterium]
MSKIALVTGGSRGIGLGIAQKLAAEGWDLAINGVREESAITSVLEGLRANGGKVIYCQGNVGESADRRQMMEQVKAELGGLNVLVNNAGVAPRERRDILETTEESYDYVMDINLKGSYFLCQAAANWLVTQKKADPDFWGCMINISSISATVASVNRGEYCVSKAGMSMVTQLFATRLGEYDLPVYEVRPGVIMTDMTGGVKEKYDKLIAEGLSVQKRWGLPEDVGKTVAMLARRDMPFSTGQVLMVDGGITLPRL